MQTRYHGNETNFFRVVFAYHIRTAKHIAFKLVRLYRALPSRFQLYQNVKLFRISMEMRGNFPTHIRTSREKD